MCLLIVWNVKEKTRSKGVPSYQCSRLMKLPSSLPLRSVLVTTFKCYYNQCRSTHRRYQVITEDFQWLNESYVLRCVWHQCYIYQDIKDIWRLEKKKTEQQQKFWPKREEFKWDQRDTRDNTLTLQILKVSLWREVVRHKFHKLGDRIHSERFFQCLGRSLPYDGR